MRQGGEPQGVQVVRQGEPTPYHCDFNSLYNEKQVKKQPALWFSECRLLFCRVSERILPWFHCPYPSRPFFWSRHKNTVPANAISTNVSTMALW